MIGRGASDDKGQLVAHLAAIEAMQALGGQLPATVTIVCEGEEEVGSPHLAPILDAIDADVAVVSDTPIPSIDRPSLT